LALEASQRSENYVPAIQEYLLALRYAPHRAPNALAIGRILFLLHQPAQALAWFQKALRMEPRYWECDLWIARCLAQLGKPRLAQRVLMNLKVRRDVYLRWRSDVREDLPTPNDPSNYDKTLLSYDESVIDRELAALRH
jgi:tetratricopeptide (TPR) repeat protein